MGKVETYKAIVRKIVDDVGMIGARPDSPIQTQIIQDDPKGHYLLFSNGWRGDNRVYGCYLHIDVKEDGKVWLQHDGTDLIIGEMLLEAGVEKTDLVLGFHAPFVRADTGFAVA
jgi:XisI protein